MFSVSLKWRGYACRTTEWLETGIQVFATERRRITLERGMEEAERKRKKPVPVEELEPMG